MKLEVLYKDKICPYRGGYRCDSSRCVKFISCIKNELNTLRSLGGIDIKEEAALNNELIKSIKHEIVL
jgi:hypothetical protein